MTDKFHNRYLKPSTRLQNWDYRWGGIYLITICTQNRTHYFGEIENGQMKLSSIGVFADVMWHEIKHHSKNIKLDAYVVMPNHIHGILILNKSNENHKNDMVTATGGGDVVDMGTVTDGGMVTEKINVFDGGNVPRGGNVETGHALSLQQSQQQQQQQQSSQSPPEKTIGQKRFQNIGNNSTLVHYWFV